MKRKLRYYELENTSGDWNYYVVTPQLVWALSRNPYDFTLWCVIKMVAGDGGTCWVSTENLAHLAMMSIGQVSKSRKYLLDTGLLIGEKKAAEKRSLHEGWHIKIPDVWAQNIAWRTAHHPLGTRIEFKKQQMEAIKNARKAERDRKKNLHGVKGNNPSPHEE